MTLTTFPATFARRVRDDIALLPLLLWTLVHAAVYFVLLVIGSVVLQLVDGPADPFFIRVVAGFAGALWISIILLPCAIVLLLVLQLFRGLALPWFRLAGLVLFGLPVLLVDYSSAMWILLAGHALMALVVVKPAV